MTKPLRYFYTSAQQDQMVALYQEGLSLRAVAEQIGTNQQTVWNTLMKRGIPLRTKTQATLARWKRTGRLPKYKPRTRHPEQHVGLPDAPPV